MKNNRGIAVVELLVAFGFIFFIMLNIIYLTFKETPIAKPVPEVKVVEAKPDLNSCSYVGTSRNGKRVVQCDDDKFLEAE